MKIIKIVIGYLLIISILVICYLLITNFFMKINNQKLDTSYMWNINYDNLNTLDGSKEANLNLDQNNLSLEVTFENEEEYYEFSVDIVNRGVYDAQINDIKLLVDNPKNILIYKLTYDDGTEIKINDIIKSNDKKTIKLRIDYPKQESKIYEKLTIKISLFIDFKSM